MEDKKPPDIRKRAFQYSLRAIKLFQALQDCQDRAGWILGKQFLRSATSIGANLEEGRAAESRADFIHKYSIAQKEAREALYWLHLLDESGIVEKSRLQALLQETEEIIAIVTKILVRTKKGPAPK